MKYTARSAGQPSIGPVRTFSTMSEKKYVETSITNTELKKLKKAKNDEAIMNGYYEFKRRLFDDELKNWQKEGRHFAYLNYGGEEMRCTCGLVVPKNDESDLKPAVLNKLSGLDLDLVQKSSGHRQLPSCQGQVDAFVYSYTYVGGLGMYNYHCLCQQCGEHIKDKSGNEAITWCKFHNLVCAS
jgi:hypothetical protein